MLARIYNQIIFLCVLSLSGCLATKRTILKPGEDLPPVSQNTERLKDNPNPSSKQILSAPHFEIQEIELNGGALAAYVILSPKAGSQPKPDKFLYSACEIVNAAPTSKCIHASAFSTSFAILGLTAGPFEVSIRECLLGACSPPTAKIYVQKEPKDLELQELYRKKQSLSLDLMALGVRIAKAADSYTASLKTCKDESLQNALTPAMIDSIHKLGPDQLGILLGTSTFDLDQLQKAAEAESKANDKQKSLSDKIKPILYDVCIGGTSLLIYKGLGFAGKTTASKLKAAVEPFTVLNQPHAKVPIIGLSILGVGALAWALRDQLFEKLHPQKLTQALLEGASKSLELTGSITKGCEETDLAIQEIRKALDEVKIQRSKLDVIVQKMTREKDDQKAN